MNNVRLFSLKKFFILYCLIFTILLASIAIYCWYIAFPNPTKVTLFSNDKCPAAIITMQTLKERGIPFDYRNTDNPLNDLAFSIALDLPEAKKVRLPYVLVNGTKSEHPPIDFIEQQYQIANAR